MAKYTEDVARLLELVGGKENISAVTHCMTRMRFVLVDEGKADVKAIEDLPAAKGTFTQAGQFQVIIGNDVADFYQEFTKVSGIEGVSKEAAKAAAGANQNPLQRAMGVLGEIFAPLIPALICGGLILGFRNIIGEVNFFNDAGAFDLEHGTLSIADMSTFWMGMYSFLWVIGEAVFHMLPVGICWSVTRKMGTTPILGIILGLTLVSPQLLNGFSVATATPEDIAAHTYDFGFYSFVGTGYQGQVIASLLAAFVLVYLEKFFTKVCPEVVRMIVVPFMSLVPAVFIAHLVVGPIGWAIGDAIANVVNAGLSSSFRVIFAALFGALYAPLVMTGLHHMTNAIDTQLVNNLGYTTLWPMIALLQHRPGLRRARHDRAAEEQRARPAGEHSRMRVVLPGRHRAGALRCEPQVQVPAALRHDRLRLRRHGLHRSFREGALHRRRRHPRHPVHHVRVLGRVRPVHGHRHRGALCADDDRGQAPAGTRGPRSVCHRGQVCRPRQPLPIPPSSPKPTAVNASPAGPGGPAVRHREAHYRDAPTPSFPASAWVTACASSLRAIPSWRPPDATVTVTMPASNHAVGLTLDNGVELLIHVGIDTVAMGGEGFSCHVKQGDRVKAGEPLLTFSTEKIAAAGHPATTAFIVAATAKATDFEFETGMDAEAGTTEVVRFRA